MLSIPKLVSGELFSRHHEKVYLVDDFSLTGSSNLTIEYGGIKYGINLFHDLNLYIWNHPLNNQIRKYCQQIADRYKI